MGREVRKVKSDWKHPKDGNGNFKPLYDGYNAALKDFMDMTTNKGLQEAIDYMGVPDKNDYMPDWPEEERTHLMMYEDTSEGTPISPAFEKPEDLAKWLADNKASSFGSMTATYDQWLKMIIGFGWSPSSIVDKNGLKSGVEFIGND